MEEKDWLEGNEEYERNRERERERERELYEQQRWEEYYELMWLEHMHELSKYPPLEQDDQESVSS